MTTPFTPPAIWLARSRATGSGAVPCSATRPPSVSTLMRSAESCGSFASSALIDVVMSASDTLSVAWSAAFFAASFMSLAACRVASAASRDAFDTASGAVGCPCTTAVLSLRAVCTSASRRLQPDRASAASRKAMGISAGVGGVFMATLLVNRPHNLRVGYRHLP